MYVCVHKIACKGTKKNVYVQEKVYFCLEIVVVFLRIDNN